MVSLPSFYLSAPTSPTGHSLKNPGFYSTMSSPEEPVVSSSFGFESAVEKTNDHEFEFEFETSRRLDSGWDRDENEYSLPSRANSFSTMAFADELFCNGQVLPLKLPPRLQSSVPTSPRSFSSRMRNPFMQRCMWNDDFDPFMIALEKVSEEISGRKSVHRRSRSYSPFRARTISRGLNCNVNWDGEKPEQTKPKSNMPEMAERKGSIYSKWVRSQTMVKNRTDLSMHHSPTAQTMIKRLWLGKRVSDAEFSQSQPVKPIKRNNSTESKMQKVKSVLLSYASLKKETTETKQTQEIVTISKISYFKRLSLTFKTNRRKKESVEPKMVLIKHKTKLPQCLGYAPASPTMKRKLDIS